MLSIGVIGYGYWGPNIVRNFRDLPTCNIVAVCDQNPPALTRLLAAYPGIKATQS